MPSHTTHALQPLDVGVYGPVKSSWRQILKEYIMETCAAMVDKTVFSCLLKKLWKAPFKAQHLKTDFCKAGLCPLSKDSIPKSSYAPSLPHTSQSQVSTQVQIHDKGNNVHEDTHIVHVQVSCCQCANERQMTPVRVYLRGYFARHWREKGTKTACRRVKPVYSGEALTTDDIYERLEEDDRQKKEKQQQQLEKK